MIKHFDDGYAFYREKRFEQAIRSFESAAAAHPQDMTSQIYIERCRSFVAEPPPENWDGVYIMKTK
jgi:adenylate cyclase